MKRIIIGKMSSRTEAGVGTIRETGVPTEAELISQEFSAVRADAVDLLNRHAIRQLRGPINVLYAGLDINDHLYPVGDQYSVKGVIDQEKKTSLAVVAFTYRRNIENVDIVELIEADNPDTLVLKKNGGYVLQKEGDKGYLRRRSISLSELQSWKNKLSLLKGLENKQTDGLSLYSPSPAVEFDERGARII